MEQRLIDCLINRVKILLQIQDSHKHIPKDQQYKGIVDCFSRIYREQGTATLYVIAKDPQF
jgi:solute carrier family 25 (adenine nucleotide translocator) protein 4/5/6/31